MCPKFCTDAKPYKHTQTLALRKASGIVRFWMGWCGARGGGDFAMVVGMAVFGATESNPSVLTAEKFAI